jgi:hypothetical protein
MQLYQAISSGCNIGQNSLLTKYETHTNNEITNAISTPIELKLQVARKCEILHSGKTRHFLRLCDRASLQISL